MQGPRGAEDPQGLDDYEEVVIAFAEQVKSFWRMWGPMGEPMIQAVETWTEGQRRYLQWLRQTYKEAASAGNEAVLPLVEEVMLGEADPVARARLRGIHMKKALLEAEGGSVSTAEAAQLLGGISKQAMDKRRERGTILALPTGDGGYAFPLWQFDERSRDGLLPGFARVLKSFSVESPWMQAEFMLSPSTRFGGRRPLDVLAAGEVGEVARAASAYGEQGAQ